jgi:hypothetical protein
MVEGAWVYVQVAAKAETKDPCGLPMDRLINPSITSGEFDVMESEIKELSVQATEEDDNRSAFIIVYMMCAFSGFLVGLLFGWMIWH